MAQRMMACLAMAALAGAMSCTDAPTATPETAAPAVVPRTDSVTLTYICGNMFRIRNASFEPRNVRWAIYNATPADTGSLRARGRDVGSTYVEYFVTSRTKGTMRLFVGTTLVNTKANGNKVACAAPVDTSPLPAVNAVRTFVLTSTILRDSSVASRTQVNVRFAPSAGAAARRAFQRAFSAQYLGSVGRVQLFQIPDFGADPDSLDALIDRMEALPGVQNASFFQVLERVRIDRARFPRDTGGYQRIDYIFGSSRIWAAKALRLPQAWACETGLYGSPPVRLMILEQNFSGELLPDLASSVAVTRFSSWKADSTLPQPSQNYLAYYQNHGAAVTSVLTARGDNGVGIAGVIWGSSTTVFSMENSDSLRGAGPQLLWKLGMGALAAAKPRVLSLSSDWAAPSAKKLEASAAYSFDIMRQLLDSVPDMLIVKSAGNDSLASGTYSQVSVTRRGPLLTGLLQLRDSSTAFRDRILFVGSTDQNTDRAAFSNQFPEVEIYAPGVDIPVLRPNGAVVVESGTSFSTPIVAAIAGQLLAMDPTLSAAGVKALLLDGARDSVESSTGINRLPTKVGGITGDVFEADAYGSLRLLSGRSASSPLCGGELSSWRNPADPQDSRRLGAQVKLYGGSRTQTFTDGYTLSPQSLAFGGRLLSATPGLRFVFSGGVWHPWDKYPDGQRRLFGERDTLTYIMPDTLTLRMRVMPTGPSWNDATAALGISSSSIIYGQPSMSPDGSRVLVPVHVGSDTATRFGHFTNNGAAILSTSLDSASQYGRMAWSPDGSRAIFYAFGVTGSGSTSTFGFGTRLALFSFNGATVALRTLAVEDYRLPWGASWSDEGNRITLLDATIGQSIDGYTDCRRRVFHVNASGPMTLISSEPITDPTYCRTEWIDSPDWDLYLSTLGTGTGGGTGGDGGGGGGDGSGGGMSGRALQLPDQGIELRRLLRDRLIGCRKPRGCSKTPAPNF